jgi:hypothetical protein
LLLATTWMPRYVQPRIVPNDIENVPTEFDVLSDQQFNPASVRPLIKAYEQWIDREEENLDPAQGAEDAR